MRLFQLRVALIITSLSATACDQVPSERSARAQVPTAPVSTPRWEAIADPEVGMWRIDRLTGQMERCTIGIDQQAHCVQAPLPSTEKPAGLFGPAPPNPF